METVTKTVYNYFTHKPVFSGTAAECKDWILSQAYTMKNGCKIFRTWEEQGSTMYDVGQVYFIK